MPDGVIHAIHYSTNVPVTLRCDGGHIASIDPAPPRADLPIVAPGFVDLQINGCLGHDFNRLPLADGTVERAVEFLARQGVTAFLPTLITNDADALTDGMRAIARTLDREPPLAAFIPGIHLEGPFISPEDGARGAHARAFVRAPDWELMQRWQEAAGGRIRILTMSPEWPGSPEFIARCTAAGINVSIGHTSATPQQVRDAVSAGARMSTHFGNGAHLMLPRHPNYLWEQLAADELWACLIADGFHIPDQVLKVVMKVKGERAMLVSDAVALAGMPPGRYGSPVGGDVVLTAEGRLHLADNDKLLAGSAQLLLHGVLTLVGHGLADFATAWDMASTRPAAFLNLPQAAGLAAGAPADFVLLRRVPFPPPVLRERAREGVSDDAKPGRCRIMQTYKGGADCYHADLEK